MAPTASIIVPTRGRPGYLEVALASILPQASAAGAEVVVIDDGPDPVTRAVAERHGARYVAPPGARGLNAARNAGMAAAEADLLVFVDDDIRAHPGWLTALLEADAAAAPEVGVLTGPIYARFEDHPLRSCGREGPPISAQDFGAADRDVDHAWGANMTIRRSALQRAGSFDEEHATGAGDEEEWERRLLQAGGRIRYVATAAVDHRRAGEDARLRSLARAAFVRGETARRFDAGDGRAPGLASEVRVAIGCVVHAARFRCPNGLVLAAHAAGRTRAALRAPAHQAGEDFLSGTSGTVAGRRGALRHAADRALDAEAWSRRRRLDRDARAGRTRRRVLVLGVRRPGRLMDAALDELRRSRHDIELRTTAMVDGRGKFEHLNVLLAEHPADGHDWLLVLDDDVVLPAGFLDRFLHCAEAAGLALAQPAHRMHSHAAWPVTRRRAGGATREARFVEIGPVTAFAQETFAHLLPFPDLRMGWGLDLHWGALARRYGWRTGIVDATPVLHAAPAGAGYDRATAVAEARAFLADRPYVTRAESGWWRRVR